MMSYMKEVQFTTWYYDLGLSCLAFSASTHEHSSQHSTNVLKGWRRIRPQREKIFGTYSQLVTDELSVSMVWSRIVRDAS
ncbi:hypothetical protein VN97_g10111 [Penicillium thymicola]|uniref:Uncharacterized protein n=1 Tax=Penicillium thymicola TaxID=293382 RepID=A0AAI9T9K5_PENTH|nr:hypothetical protein VN97_g10111 [Penicillium thymicola]